ncbi:MAG: hypothetical protein K2K50_02115, partial [Anaeroplasmataceae bacterium]|nr:hypothetical protein [Anaeroplasmataceae bacterium]
MDNFNIFICYRGKRIKKQENQYYEKDKKNYEDYSDGKYIALDIYSELQKYEECNCFFAPKHYKPQDDFK